VSGKPVIQLIFASIVTIFLVPLGLAYSLIKPIIDSGSKPILFVIKKFGSYWLNILIQFWRSFKYIAYHTALFLDYTWNVFAGELLEDIITWKENTWFGNGKTTVSASIGQLEDKESLNKAGKLFSSFLNFIFNEENHTLKSYKNQLNQNEDTSKQTNNN
jgi:hypothetical protein